MPTYDEEESFWRDWERLTSEQRRTFLSAVYKMIADIRSGKGFRKGLRIKGVQGNPLIFEMTWANDGRATFMYGISKVDGDTHIIWRRIGTHAILKNP